MKMKSPILLLTDDLLLKIISLLTDDSDRKSLRSTCKPFLHLDSLHRTHLRLLHPDFLPSLLPKLPSLSSLDLSVCPRIDVSLLLPSAPRLTRLLLSRCSFLPPHSLRALATACPHLQTLDLSYCTAFGDLEAAAISAAASLRDLNLDKCLNVTDVGLAQVAAGCPDLESLSLKWCFDVTDIGLRFLSKKCLHLKRLDISYLKVSNESLHWISGMERLDTLQMVGCGSVDHNGLLHIANGCASLKVLDISRCDRLSMDALCSVIHGHNRLLELHASYCFSELSMSFVNQLKDLKSLKVLRIDGARVRDPMLKIISNNCKCLTEVGLGKCRVTDTGIWHLVSGCVNLKVLDLTCCSDLTDSAILAIARSCRDLSCLKLECCNLLGEGSLNHLGSHCRFLEEIDLTDCSGINDIGLKYLSRCSELVSLKLGLCVNISDKGLSYMASNCSKIRELDLYRCEGIGDGGLAAISRSCKKLKVLNLSYCDGVTDEGMAYLSSLEELSSLEMRSLRNITATGLTKLAAGCRRLAELDVKNCKGIDDSGFWALAYYSRNLQQINVSGCVISDVGLCMVMGNLTRLQDAKLLDLARVSADGVEVALRACCACLKKVKLSASLRRLLSPQIVQTLEANGCKIRWD
ncbi:F-box/LRR-repeat protein 3-like [Salvia hispanica]|uniref:F-box/LRR-repeat protein 3-like n=1 Tax=Salvia hispanica TaxID=49212 RepID=UPI002009A449|nr:F-box/LRR-repeat protein 3-like [Salvia hispanica]